MEYIFENLCEIALGFLFALCAVLYFLLRVLLERNVGGKNEVYHLQERRKRHNDDETTS